MDGLLLLITNEPVDDLAEILIGQIFLTLGGNSSSLRAWFTTMKHFKCPDNNLWLWYGTTPVKRRWKEQTVEAGDGQ